jgi:para-aminobenzoate synthetase / 4-amino-4-deoxychorismate lyase
VSGPLARLRCRIDHTATDDGALLLRLPVAQLEARRTSEVSAVLAEAEAAARLGNYVAGYVSYDAASAFDAAFRVPAASPHASTLPLAWFGVFALAVPVPALPNAGEAPPDDGTSRWRCEIDAGMHESAIAAIRAAIAEGDAYLVNYTTRLHRPWCDEDDPFELYCRLVASHGPGYHAFIETDEWALACGSPELFFEQADDIVVTRPMKGTAPRGRWPEEDAARGAELRASPKERAENVMVVDMLRNDLGRIAVPGSVAVPSLWQVQRHPALWQLSSTVTARTHSEVTLADVFGALFPCASVTGAPKISAMSVISDLEASPRGVYCGAVGLLAPVRRCSSTRPGARFAVAIRTAVVDKAGGVAHYGSGGGITSDSAPESEWDEVLLKTRTLNGPSAPSIPQGHGLIETMRFTPDDSGGRVRNLEAHLARLTASARYFGLPVPTGVEDLVAAAVHDLRSRARVRLVLRPDGSIEVETAAFPPVPGSTLRLCVDPVPVSSNDVALFHKTTDRRRYEERALRHAGADDVVLVNERGEVTETTRANLAVRLDGQWCTPPLDSGLLPGIERARRIAEGRLVERLVTLGDLRRASGVATLSSLRGWLPAAVDLDCGCCKSEPD